MKGLVELSPESMPASVEKITIKPWGNLVAPSLLLSATSYQYELKLHIRYGQVYGHILRG